MLDSKIRFLNIESKSYSNVIENVFEKNYYSVSYRKRRTVDSKYFAWFKNNPIFGCTFLQQQQCNQNVFKSSYSEAVHRALKNDFAEAFL